ADDVFQARYRQALADAGSLIDPLIPTGFECNSFDDLFYKIGNVNLSAGIPMNPRFLFGDCDSVFQTRGIVRFDFRTDTVLQRRDDLSARRVVFGIRGENQNDIERQANGIAFNLYIAFLHDVEQTHLDFSSQIRKLIYGKNAAVRARQQSIVDTQL